MQAFSVACKNKKKHSTMRVHFYDQLRRELLNENECKRQYEHRYSDNLCVKSELSLDALFLAFSEDRFTAARKCAHAVSVALLEEDENDESQSENAQHDFDNQRNNFHQYNLLRN